MPKTIKITDASGAKVPATAADLLDMRQGLGVAAADHAHTAGDVGAAPAAHTHTMLMTQGERDQLTGLQVALDGKATSAQGEKADSALQPGALPVGTTLPVAQISDAGAAGRTILQMQTLAEIQYSVSEYALLRRSRDTALLGLPLIAARAIFADGVVAGQIKTTYRSRRWTPTGGCDVRFVYANVAGDAIGSELAGVESITVQGAVEYPLGVIYPVSFGGAESASIPPGGLIVSDPVSVDLPAGTRFWDRTCVSGAAWPAQHMAVASSVDNWAGGDSMGAAISGATNATPIVVTTTGPHGLSSGDAVRLAAVGGNTAANGSWAVTVLTPTTFALSGSAGNGAYSPGSGYVLGIDTTRITSGSMVASGGVKSYGPIAIIAAPLGGVLTPWIAAFGDSILSGANETTVNAGWLVRALGGPVDCTIPHVILSRPGTRCGQFVAPATIPRYSAKRRLFLGAPYTINQYGANDLATGASLITMQTNAIALAFAAARRGSRHMICTLTPSTSSSDAWATAGGQTVTAAESVRVSYNDWVRAGAPIDTSGAPVVIGTAGALLAGQAGHPVYSWIDQSGAVEVDAGNAPAVNGGRWIATGAPNYATNDGVHPTSAGHTLIAARVDVGRFAPYA